MIPPKKKKMDIQTIGLLIALGIATGALSSIVGVGGGIILILLGVIGFLLHKLKKARQSWQTIN